MPDVFDVLTPPPPLSSLACATPQVYGTAEAHAHLLLHASAAARLSGSLSAAAFRLTQVSSLAHSFTLPRIAIRAQWEHAQLLWAEGNMGQHSAHGVALAAATVLVGRATATAGDMRDPAGGGPSSLLDRWVLAQACRVSASWALGKGRCSWAEAETLHLRAIELCGNESIGTEERCEAHSAFASWLESGHRTASLQRGTSATEQRTAQLYAMTTREAGATQARHGALQYHATLCAATSAAETAVQQQRLQILRAHIDRHESDGARQDSAQLALAVKSLRQHAACALAGDSHDHSAVFAIVAVWLDYGARLGEAQQEVAWPRRRLLITPTTPPLRHEPAIYDVHSHLPALSAR